MKIVLQRVKRAHVTVEHKIIGQIADGFVLLLGVGKGDTQKDADWLVEKIVKLRLFADEESNTFMEKNIQQTGGQILIVSQFTLFGDCKKGTRPSFSEAASPEDAKKLYEYFVEKVRSKGVHVETGQFAAHMDVELVNDGPITLILDTIR